MITDYPPPPPPPHKICQLYKCAINVGLYAELNMPPLGLLGMSHNLKLF